MRDLRALADHVAREIVRRELRRELTPAELVAAAAQARALGQAELAEIMEEAAR